MSDNSMQKRILTAASITTSSSGWMIKSLAKKIDNALLKVLKPYGLNLDHFAIMRVLLESDNISQAQIGESVSMPAYAITRHIDVLENDGYLIRSENAVSRRSNQISLTAKGRSMLAVLCPIVQEINSKILAPLAGEEKRQLKKLLMKVISEKARS